MLPLPLQFIIAMVDYAINERMARRFDYLLEEVRVLREVYAETSGRKRIPFTDAQRRRLAVKGNYCSGKRDGRFSTPRAPRVAGPTARK